jgi:hypothetical protein
MGSGMFRVIAVSAALSLTSGCMFTQWTDNAFFGVLEDPPTHYNREWLGIMVLPLAVAGDIITAPAQAIALMITGDYGIYQGSDGRISMNEDPSREMRVAALDADGKVVSELVLTPAQKLELAARIQSGAAAEVATN